MADMRQRSIAEDLKNKEMRKAQSILVYGEQRYEYAHDVPWTKTKGSDVFWHAVVDGFCGALSTASTFTSEFRMLKEAPHAPRGYIYASMMLLAGQVAAVPFVASIPSM